MSNLNEKNKYHWHYARTEDNLCGLRSKGYVAQVYHNGSDHSYHIMTDKQYQLYCLTGFYHVVCEGSGSHQDCIDKVEEFLDAQV